MKPAAAAAPALRKSRRVVVNEHLGVKGMHRLRRSRRAAARGAVGVFAAEYAVRRPLGHPTIGARPSRSYARVPLRRNSKRH
jgi:hypothetical protein